MLQIKTLGELRQTGEPGQGRALRRKPLALVVYLARRAPRSVSRTELATLFWGERGEDRARQSLRQALLEVKQALGDAIDVDADSVRLTGDQVRLDIADFEEAVSDGRAADAATRWTGDFFAGAEDIGGDGFRRWIESERTGLHQQLGVTMEKLIGEHELRGDWTGAATWAERWAVALPFDERAHLRLIEALRMTDRTGEALQAHAGFITRVRSALDVEPSAEFLAVGGGLADDARGAAARKGRGSVAIHSPQMVGRGPMLGALVSALEEATAGSPVVVLVRGAVGSGRARLIDELISRIGAGVVVLRGRGEPGTDLGTAAALLEGIRGAPGAVGAAPEWLAEIARIVPSLATRFQHLPRPVGDENALAGAIAQTVAAIGEDAPVLVVLDDLHRADEASRRILLAAATRLAGRVLLVFTDDDSAPGPVSVAAGFRGIRDLRQVQLDPLSVADVEILIGSMVAMDPDERRALAARIHEDTVGVPLWVRDLVTILIEDHLLQLDGAGLWRITPVLTSRQFPVPPAVREGASLWLSSLSPPARGLADALAILSEPAMPSVLAEIAGVPEDDAEAAVAELRQRRMFLEDRALAGHYRFVAPLIGRVVIAVMMPSRRQALHARSAEVLSRRDIATTSDRNLIPYHLARASVPVPAGPAPASRKRVRWRVAAGVVGVAALVATGFLLRNVVGGGTAVAGADAAPVVALGRIVDYRENRYPDLTRPLADMLATNLGRVPRLRVVSSARMYELVSQGEPAAREPSAAGLVTAARRAGATEMVDGALYARDDGGLRLDLRRVDLANGNIRQTYSVTGDDIFALADSGTARLAGDFGAASPAGSIADVTTRSVAAYRLYEQGLRSYYTNDYQTAQPLFAAAFAEDTTFAMAAYYDALSSIEPRHILSRFATAARLAARTSDRERLTIQARFALLSSSPALGPIADTLVVRYPDEVDGYYFTGLSRMVSGRFLEALEPFQRVIRMDSLALSGARPICLACDALRQMISNYQLADSLPAAERVARRWARLQPTSPVPWQYLAEVYSQASRPADALAALDRQGELDAGRREGERLLARAVHRIYALEFEEADRLLAGEVDNGSPARELQGNWYRAISYRGQGRLEEALADARRVRALALATYPPRVRVERRALPTELFVEGQVLYEMGRFRQSAAVFDSISRWRVGDETPSQNAHAELWAMTHAARARAAAGDTAGLWARADTIQTLSEASGSERDRLLHRYVRGLVLAARGQDVAAVEEFRRAIYSWSFGYTQTNVALAQALLRLGRAREAVAAIGPPIRGNLEASNYYVTRTDAHEQLGLAWAAVGGPAARDSAEAHFRVVEKAWSRADPSFAPRLERIRAARAALAAAR